MNIKVGQGFNYKNKYGDISYGLIVETNDMGIKWFPVIDVPSNVRNMCSYDDSRAVYPRDKDNVRLDSCPPPFTAIGCYFNFKHERISSSMVIADLPKMRSMSFSTFGKFCQIIDDGITVSQRDMETVFNHPWQSRRQKEKLISDMSELNLDDVHQDFDFQ